MEKNILESTIANDSVRVMCADLQRDWIPPCPDHLQHIRVGITSGRYDARRDLLVNDLKRDVALFLYTIRALSALPSNRFSSNPISLVREASNEDLRKILCVSPTHICPRELDTTDEVQMQRYVQALVSAAVAEQTARFADIDVDLAFSSALLRQLGLILVAFNHPEIYRRALRTNGGISGVERAIEQMLGSSPSLLGLMITETWNLSPEVRLAMDRTSIPGDEAVSRLRRCCELGELVARAQDPSLAVQAKTDFSAVRVQIEAMCGPSSWSAILGAANHACEVYRELAPYAIEQLHALELEAAPSTRMTNPYLDRIPAFLAERLREAYEAIEGGRVSPLLLRNIAVDAAHSAGFTRGCVYLIDPSRGVLSPRLTLGDTRLETLRTLPMNSVENEISNPVVKAFSTGEVTLGGKALMYLCRSVGHPTKPLGVVYLEIPRGTFEVRKDELVFSFCAIVQTLTDLLSMKVVVH